MIATYKVCSECFGDVIPDDESGEYGITLKKCCRCGESFVTTNNLPERVNEGSGAQTRVIVFAGEASAFPFEVWADYWQEYVTEMNTISGRLNTYREAGFKDRYTALLWARNPLTGPTRPMDESGVRFNEAGRPD